jgi:hypothetical protein
MTRHPIPVLLLSLAILWPAAASGGLVTWELEGTIESAYPIGNCGGCGAAPVEAVIQELDAVGVTPGSPWSARLRFDPDVAPDPCEACVESADFTGATKSIDFTAGTFSASTPEGRIDDAISFSSGGESSLWFYSPMEIDSRVLVARSATVVLHSLDTTLLFLATLPNVPPNLSTLDLENGSGFTLIGAADVRNSDSAILRGEPVFIRQSFAIGGRILSITPVPEPSLFALVLAAAAASALRRRSRALP